MMVPSFLLKRLYVKGSLKPTADGFEFTVLNQLGSGYARQILPVTLDGEKMPLERTYFRREGGDEIFFSDVDEQQPFTLEVGKALAIGVRGVALTPGAHKVGLGFVVQGIGALSFEVSDIVG
ncbi:MAG: hypothetical protein ACYC5O_16680 [Anaerolineae bacterium]